MPRGGGGQQGNSVQYEGARRLRESRGLRVYLRDLRLHLRKVGIVKRCSLYGERYRTSSEA